MQRSTERNTSGVPKEVWGTRTEVEEEEAAVVVVTPILNQRIERWVDGEGVLCILGAISRRDTLYSIQACQRGVNAG